MTKPEMSELVDSVNRRRSDGSVSPVHTPDEHAKLLEDFNKVLNAGDEWGPYVLNEDGWFVLKSR